jgi:peroxiredoxin
MAFLAALTLAGASFAGGGVAVGDKAPDFTLSDASGSQVSLAGSNGSIRVLEWVNPDCPFVQRHYAAGTMKKLAEHYATKGVVWLAINSTSTMDAARSAAFRDSHQLPYPILVDRDGTVGHLYGAETTPHMFVIDGNGTVVYEGAIDDDPRGSKPSATNYVAAALDELLAGKPVATPETKPYGCSVKYPK